MSLRPTLGSEPFPTIDISLKMMKNVFYFILRALFIPKICKVLSWFFGYAHKQIYKKAKVNLKIYDVTDWITKNYNTGIIQYLKKER